MAGSGERLTAFGLSMDLEQWARHPRCRVSARVLAERVAEGWDFEFALVTDGPAPGRDEDLPADGFDVVQWAAAAAPGAQGAAAPGAAAYLEHAAEQIRVLCARMSQIRAAVPFATSTRELARRVGLSHAVLLETVAEMPGGARIHEALAANRDALPARRVADRDALLVQRAAAHPRPVREVFTPTVGEVAELRALIERAWRERSAAGDEARLRAAARRNAVVKSWKLQGATAGRIAYLAQAPEQAVRAWLSSREPGVRPGLR